MRNHHCIVNCIGAKILYRLQISFIISKSSPRLSCKVVQQSLTITNYQLSHIFTQSQSSSSTIIPSHKSHSLTSIVNTTTNTKWANVYATCLQNIDYHWWQTQPKHCQTSKNQGYSNHCFHVPSISDCIFLVYLLYSSPLSSPC